MGNLFYESEIYFYIYQGMPVFLHFNNFTLNFSYKVYKSFVICKTLSKRAVIYALSLGNL